MNFVDDPIINRVGFFPEKTIFSFPESGGKTGNIRKKLEEMEISGKNYA